MKQFRLAFAISLIFMVIAVSAQLAGAQDFSQELVVKRASSKLIEGFLESLGFKFREVGNGSYSFMVRGYKVVLFNKGDDLQLYAAFSGKRVTLTRVNEWNRTKRFSKAYLDNDGDAVIENDLDFEGGVTSDTILRFIAVFAQSVEAFSDHIG